MTEWWKARDIGPELIVVLQTIADALHGRAPNADLVRTIAPQCRPHIPWHQVAIQYTPRPPKGSRPRRKAFYTISICGPGVDGRWVFHSW